MDEPELVERTESVQCSTDSSETANVSQGSSDVMSSMPSASCNVSMNVDMEDSGFEPGTLEDGSFEPEIPVFNCGDLAVPVIIKIGQQVMSFKTFCQNRLSVCIQDTPQLIMRRKHAAVQVAPKTVTRETQTEVPYPLMDMAGNELDSTLNSSMNVSTSKEDPDWHPDDSYTSDIVEEENGVTNESTERKLIV
ncbi:uncharacterized protein LOC123526223 [Mercenaria mercenaria]|uniref:uncharacterized protein LOC123526223 n=1 Tax=Mercenaria mercenaria TaxID=6596 RepID=UPI00234E78C0|nr:uncharacterized protein LOC123526223 [Mercenaria mercenaria]